VCELDYYVRSAEYAGGAPCRPAVLRLQRGYRVGYARFCCPLLEPAPNPSLQVKNPLHDLYLMSRWPPQCNSDSSFFLVGGLLNPHPGKIHARPGTAGSSPGKRGSDREHDSGGLVEDGLMQNPTVSVIMPVHKCGQVPGGTLLRHAGPPGSA